IPDIEIVSVDVRNWKETETAVKKLGPIDLLVNNAGVISLQEFGTITEEEVDKNILMICVNTSLSDKQSKIQKRIIISIIIAKGMKERGAGGAIVNISSQAAIIALPNHATYCASKGALDQITKVMALELGPHKIRVNSVNPTVVLTDMGITALKSYGEGKHIEDALKAKIPLRKFCDVDDVVKATLFLLSDDAGMITGAQLPLDGGYIIHSPVHRTGIEATVFPLKTALISLDLKIRQSSNFNLQA
ncbi:UNVERIFIED_CONTAM: L-xylulose reductase, partial [Trichonephila clavipes]